MPVTLEGRAPSTPDEVAVSSTLGLGVGDEIENASRTLHTVGVVENSTALANLPNVFLTTAGAQQLVYGGRPLVASIGIRGIPIAVPAGYHAVDRAGAIADLLRPVKVAVNSITIVAIMLWIVAALVVGSGTYLSALERLRDFAVFKAIGVPTRDIAGGLALQAIVVALLAALVARERRPDRLDSQRDRAAAGSVRRSRHSVRRPVSMGDLSIQNLVVEYSSGGYPVRPIDGLDLDVAAGSLALLLGPSGCGKTTLL